MRNQSHLLITFHHPIKLYVTIIFFTLLPPLHLYALDFYAFLESSMSMCLIHICMSSLIAFDVLSFNYFRTVFLIWGCKKYFYTFIRHLHKIITSTISYTYKLINYDFIINKTNEAKHFSCSIVGASFLSVSCFYFFFLISTICENVLWNIIGVCVCVCVCVITQIRRRNLLITHYFVNAINTAQTISFVFGLLASASKSKSSNSRTRLIARS